MRGNPEVKTAPCARCGGTEYMLSEIWLEAAPASAAYAPLPRTEGAAVAYAVLFALAGGIVALAYLFTILSE